MSTLWCLIFVQLHTSYVKSQQYAISDRFYHSQNHPRLNDVPWSSGMKPTSTFFQNVCRCSRIYRNRHLINVRPFEVMYTQSEQDCVCRCATVNSDMKMACASLNYCRYDRRCELFQSALDQPPYAGKCTSVYGCNYYSINAACLGTVTSSRVESTVTTASNAPTTTSLAITFTTATAIETSTPFVTFTEASSTSPLVITSESATVAPTISEIETTTFTEFVGGGESSTSQSIDQPSRRRDATVDRHRNFPDNKSCPNGQNSVYSRAEGYTDPRINIPNSKVQNIASATACQSECNKKSDCQSFDYLSSSKTCNIYNSLNKDPLQEEANVEHFDNFCIPASATCHGLIDRVPKKVQFSSPTIATAESASDCINKCLSAKPCVAASYYTDTNKDNCLLSEQSRKTDPANFVDVKIGKADYYGLDACVTAKATVKSKFVRNRDQAVPNKKTKQSELNAKSLKPTSVPNAKQYRQMVIAAQRQKLLENKAART